jgi:hypothetical protein
VYGVVVAVPGSQVGPLLPQLHPVCAEYLAGLHYLNSVNSYAGLTEFYRHAPSGPVRLAGDYFSSSNLNTATASGIKAARELDTLLARS